MTTQICTQCGRAAPDEESDEFLDWEAADERGADVVCPGCLTTEDREAMSDDVTLTLLDPDTDAIS